MSLVRLPFYSCTLTERIHSRDVNSYIKAKTSIEPTNVFRGHTSVVGVCPSLLLSSTYNADATTNGRRLACDERRRLRQCRR